MDSSELKIKKWYIAKNHPERGPGQLKKVKDIFYLLYHPKWSEGHNDNGEYQGNHCAWYTADLLTEAPHDLVFKALESSPDPQGWISVSEMLPKSRVPILCYYKDISPYSVFGVIKGIYLSEVTYDFKPGWYYYDDFYDGFAPYSLKLEGVVTHWMPLPAPPKEF